MSHALARIRERLGDPVLVRSGRAMVLTPRAEAMKARVHAVVSEAKQTLEPERPFVARELTRTAILGRRGRTPGHRGARTMNPEAAVTVVVTRKHRAHSV